jgi:enoyl-CoA hydratase
MDTYDTILYETPAPGIARIVLNRPHARNAQDLQMTYDLNNAFDRASQDNEIKVIILCGAGPHFSAGHDLRGDRGKRLQEDFAVVGTWAGFESAGAHGRFGRENEIYLDMARRWQNLSKPTIAQVHGKCIAGGLMLAWACDLIVASKDAQFSDPVVTMGVCGVELFVHPYELGHRKAKEFLFTAESWSAAEAFRLGMVNHVVEPEELESFTLTLAQKIAAKPLFALQLAKKAVNQAQTAMGQQQVLDYAFGLHQLCHSHNEKEFGIPIDPSGIPAAVKK